MDRFEYRDGQLFCEQVNIDQLADLVDTPCYVYSAGTLRDHYKLLTDAFAPVNPLICYSIKSCSNIHILKLLADAGAGMDVVSGGELYRAQQAGVPGEKIVYAGVGKTDPEIEAAIDYGIGYFNIESEAEFENIAAIAKAKNATARAALRVNPDVDPKTHAKTTTGKKETKFGVDIERARRFFATYGKDAHLKLDAIHLHIGSPIYTPDPYVDAITKAMALIDELRAQGHAINTLDIGGGFAADYETGKSPLSTVYADALVPLLKPFTDAGGRIILEPGRSIAGNAGILVAEVQYMKTGGSKTFAIVDTGMHQMVRPTLYEAFQFMWPTRPAPQFVPDARRMVMSQTGLIAMDVVGPICETGDYIAKDRALPPLQRGDRIAVFTAGAYGMTMASNYNSHGRPAEVLVDGEQATVIRRRETWQDLLNPEQTPQPVALD